MLRRRPLEDVSRVKARDTPAEKINLEKHGVGINYHEDRLWTGEDIIDMDVMSHLFLKSRDVTPVWSLIYWGR